jgi:hypothetical protein
MKKYFYLVWFLVALAGAIALVRKYILHHPYNIVIEIIMIGVSILVLVALFKLFWDHRKTGGEPPMEP